MKNLYHNLKNKIKNFITRCSCQRRPLVVEHTESGIHIRPGEVVVRSQPVVVNSSPRILFNHSGRIMEKTHSVARTLSSDRSVESSVVGTFASFSVITSTTGLSPGTTSVVQVLGGTDQGNTSSFTSKVAAGVGLPLTIASAYGAYNMDKHAEELQNNSITSLDDVLNSLEKPLILDKELELKFDVVLNTLSLLKATTKTTFNNYKGKSPVVGQIKVGEQTFVGNTHYRLLSDLAHEISFLVAIVEVEKNPEKKIEKLYKFFSNSENPISNSCLNEYVVANQITINTMLESFFSGLVQFVLKFL